MEFSKPEMTHFNNIMSIGLSVETQSRRNATFEATLFQAYIVTMATFQKNWDDFTDSYISVLPGGGKTSIVCWICKVIEKLHPKLSIAVITTEPHLVKQLSDFSVQFDLENTNFYGQNAMHLLDRDCLVIFDEYYHALWMSKLNISAAG